MFTAGDKVDLAVNGEMIPVEIISSTTANGCVRHSVRLEAPVQGCQAGEIVDGCYSRVTVEAARQYGIKREIFARTK